MPRAPSVAMASAIQRAAGPTSSPAPTGLMPHATRVPRRSIRSSVREAWRSSRPVPARSKLSTSGRARSTTSHGTRQHTCRPQAGATARSASQVAAASAGDGAADSSEGSSTTSSGSRSRSRSARTCSAAEAASHAASSPARPVSPSAVASVHGPVTWSLTTPCSGGRADTSSRKASQARGRWRSRSGDQPQQHGSAPSHSATMSPSSSGSWGQKGTS